MGFRKIIGFGDSSFVVSLPKDWVIKNGLKKGDVVSIDNDGGWLRVGPQNIRPSQNEKEITIDYNNPLELKSRLLYAYINNYNIINVKKQSIENYALNIRSVISNFVGLDVVEQKNDRIIVNDILDISNISVYNLLRRMDRIVLSMVEDAKFILEGKGDRNIVLTQKDEDVNKLCNLVLKVLKRTHNNMNDMNLLKLELNDIFYYWDLALNIENVADQLKRIIRSKKGEVDPEIIKLFDASVDHYNTAMKSNYNKDSEAAVNIVIQRKAFSSKCDKFVEKSSNDQYLMIEKIKAIHNFAGDIARTLLKLGMTPSSS